MKQPELGAYITMLRNQKNFTQKELAEQCNVDIRTIQRIENGDVLPRIYTINLLSVALGVKFDVSAAGVSIDKDGIDKKFIEQMRFSWIWGIIFSINYLGVTYNIITHSSTLYSKLSIVANIVGLILFFKGFYHFGKKYSNQLLTVSTLLSMVLVVYVNLTYFFPVLVIYYFQVYILMCVNAIFGSIGLFIQGNKMPDHGRFNLCKTTGVIGIVQSMLFLSFDFKIQSAGLVISAFCNFLSVMILYNQYRGKEKTIIKTKTGLAFN